MGRASNKKRSWRQLDTAETEKSAQLKSAADSALFVIDDGAAAAVKQPSKKSLPSKNTLKAAMKYLKTSPKTQESCAPSGAIYDLWAGSTARPAPSAPVLPRGVTNSLPPAHPGTSYNPATEDQQKAIEIAYGIHLDQTKAETTWKEKVEQAKKAVVGSELVNDDDDEEVGEEVIIVKPPIRAKNRLTKAVKNKRRRQKLLEAEAAVRKQHKRVLRQIDTIKQLSIAKAAKAFRPLTKAPRRIRLGKYHPEPEYPAVLFSDEITNNLRDVAFQPTILRDAFLRFQRKGLIETRHKVKPTPVRVKLYARYKDRD